MRGSSTPDAHLEIRWFRNSAEYRALTRQTYRYAGERVPELARGLPARGWAVILDADETVLDNSIYQEQRAPLGGYSDDSWVQWVRKRAAAAVPGSVEFAQQVHALGGRIVIVTNRADSLCVDTRENLRSLRIDPELVLCMPPGESNKNPRFQRVQAGTAGLPPLTVVAWLGDNIQDFPNMTQAGRGSAAFFADFGVKYFALPNPMYGSWTANTSP